MDPNLFHLDWERTLEALVAIIVLSFLIERALAMVFETRWWIRTFEDPRVSGPPGVGTPPPGNDSLPGSTTTPEAAASIGPSPRIPRRARLFPLKEIIVFLTALAICRGWEFDALSIILLREKTQFAGFLLTAGVIAGGSKASIKLFHDLMGVQSSASRERDALRGQRP